MIVALLLDVEEYELVVLISSAPPDFLVEVMLINEQSVTVTCEPGDDESEIEERAVVLQVYFVEPIV